MRFKARLPEVSFCREDQNVCFFLPSSFHSHHDFAMDDQLGPKSEVRPQPSSGEREESQLPGNLLAER
jgi:hypothetical protein